MKLNEDHVPATIDEAIDHIFQSLTEQDRKDIAANPHPSAVHFTLGGHLRNSWSLWEAGTPLVQDFRQRFGLHGHGDDISGMILESVYARVQGRDVAAAQEALAARCRAHWIAHGIDPATGERVQAPAEAVRNATEVVVVVDDGTGRAFDGVIKGGRCLQDAGDLHVITKTNGTKGGNPIAALIFTVQLPTGETAMAQTVVTLRNLLNATRILAERYGPV